MAAFRLLDVDPEALAIARRLDTPLVGRHAELEQLRGAYERTVRERRCHLFTVLGAAGLGKSRLAAEFLDGVDATVLAGRCLGYGEGITFWPLVAVLKQAGAAAAGTLAQVTDGGAAPSELFWAVRAQLEQLAGDRPLVVVFDDMQWGEAMFFDLIDHVADLSRGAPLMLLCLARPELLDARPAWGGGKLNATTILLEPLTAAESAELVDAHGGADPALRERIVAMADGNPLFVEEVVALVREHGDVRMPSTVQALLQARLDGLAREERTVVDGGAVEGRVFHRSAVVELTHAADIELPLVGLVRKELIHPAAPTLAGDQAFRFRHLLIRDAAYDALPKETRAELHTRFADWLEANGQDLIELDEVLGYHLEQAARYRRELGHADAGVEARAGRRLAAAGSRAVLRSDAHGAANLLARALALLPAGDPARPAALLERIGILGELGERDERLRMISELDRADDPVLRMHGRVARLDLRLATEPDDAVAEAEALADEALAVFAQAGDDLGAAHTYSLLALASWVRSRAVPTCAALERQVEHAERAGARLLAGRAMMQLIGPLAYGPFETGEIRAWLARLPVATSPLARVNAFYVEAELARRDSRFGEALDLLDRAAAVEHELGMDIASAINMLPRARILRDQGDLDGAAAAFREAIARLEETEQTSFRSTTLISLAVVLYMRGDTAEAVRLAVEGEELGAAEDVVNYADGRGLRARVAADAGRLIEAESLAREALAYAYETDFPRSMPTRTTRSRTSWCAPGARTRHSPSSSACWSCGSGTATRQRPSERGPCGTRCKLGHRVDPARRSGGQAVRRRSSTRRLTSAPTTSRIENVTTIAPSAITCGSRAGVRVRSRGTPVGGGARGARNEAIANSSKEIVKQMARSRPAPARSAEGSRAGINGCCRHRDRGRPRRSPRRACAGAGR